MKNLLLVLAISAISMSAVAQTVDGKPLETIKTPYIEIVGMAKFMSLSKVTILIDYGQSNNTRVLGEDGKPVVFSSMVDALNFFEKYGYEFVTAYAVTMNNSNVYHYLLKKKKVI